MTAAKGRRRLEGQEADLRKLPSQWLAANARVQRTAGIAQWIWDDGARRFVTGLAERAALLGLSAEHYQARCKTAETCFETIHPQDRPRYLREFDRAIDRGEAYSIEFRERTPDGRYRHFREHGQPFETGSAEGRLLAGMTEDITESKTIESRAMDGEALLRQAAGLVQLGHWVWDEIEDRCIYCSEALAGMYEMTPEVYLERYATLESQLELIHPADRARFERVVAEAKRDKTGYEIEYRERPAGESYRHFREISEPVLDDGGTLVRTLGTLQDITLYKQKEATLRLAQEELEAQVRQRTEQLRQSNDDLRREIAERQQIERALRESHDRLRLIADNLPASIMYIDRETRYQFINSTGAKWHARPASEMLGKTVVEVNETIHRQVKPQIEAVLSGETFVFEPKLTYGDGLTRDLRATYVPHRDESGEVCGYFVLAEDITKDKRTEKALRQAQTMEAVGQLSGGAAHDFNNLLEVILGNAELLSEKPGDGRELIAGIQRAGRLAKDLTQRLLAFSRRQALEPRPFDLAKLLDETEGLVRRTLGAAIAVERRAAADLWPVLADPGQVESALLNLAINARDAMPRGGRLSIEAANAVADEECLADFPTLKEGDFVVLSVGDNGDGMSEATLSRATEPFFTTKGLGEGTGLGLSMVYGFAEQSGGHLSLSSRPGVGTTVKLYLPRARGRPMPSAPRRELDVPAGRGETVLLVEDDVEVRTLLVRMLEGLGYKVFDVGDAAAALASLERLERTDVLLSDVVLPGELNGTALAQRVRQCCPQTRLVFMTGYSPMSAGAAGFDLSDGHLLRKPFSKMDLAVKLREVLGR